MKLFKENYNLSAEEKREMLKAYRKEEDSMYHTYHRYGMIIGLLIYLAFLPVDYFNLSVYRESIIFSRLAIYLPIGILMIIIHEYVRTDRMKLYTVLSFISFTWLNMTYVAIFASKEGNLSYQFGLVLTLTGVQILMNLRLRYVVEITFVLLIILNGMHLYLGSTLDMLGINLVLTMLLIMTSYRNYANDIMKRNNFYMNYKLNHDYAIIGTNNQHLEEMLNYKDQELKYMDIHDVMTSTFNRRYFDEYIRSINVRNSLPMTLIVFDIDGMKLINETFGLTRGNEFIQHGAKALQKASNSNATVFRGGGDEFYVLMEKSNGQDADQFIARVKDELERLEQHNMYLQFSFGVETVHFEPFNFEELLAGAEEKLLASKRVYGVEHKKILVDKIVEHLHLTTYESIEHVNRIIEFSKRVAEKLKLSEEDTRKLVLLSEVHDIGIVTIPSEVLKKKGNLDEGEWTLVKNHPEIGYRIARASVRFQDVAEEVLAHHENYDGTGYPKGSRGDDIPYLARIMRVIDSYEVMTSDQGNGKDMSKEEAIGELRMLSGTVYDEEIVEIMTNLLY